MRASFLEGARKSQRCRGKLRIFSRRRNVVTSCLISVIATMMARALWDSYFFKREKCFPAFPPNLVTVWKQTAKEWSSKLCPFSIKQKCCVTDKVKKRIYYGRDTVQQLFGSQNWQSKNSAEQVNESKNNNNKTILEIYEGEWDCQWNWLQKTLDHSRIYEKT